MNLDKELQRLADLNLKEYMRLAVHSHFSIGSTGYRTTKTATWHIYISGDIDTLEKPLETIANEHK